MASRYRNGGQHAPSQTQAPKGDPPCYSVKYWTGSGTVEISAFVNYNDKNQPQYSARIQKTYRAGEEYKESKSLFHEELPLVAAALLHAFQAIQDIKDGVTRE